MDHTLSKPSSWGIFEIVQYYELQGIARGYGDRLLMHVQLCKQYHNCFGALVVATQWQFEFTYVEKTVWRYLFLADSVWVGCWMNDQPYSWTIPKWICWKTVYPKISWSLSSFPTFHCHSYTVYTVQCTIFGYTRFYHESRWFPILPGNIHIIVPINYWYLLVNSYPTSHSSLI